MCLRNLLPPHLRHLFTSASGRSSLAPGPPIIAKFTRPRLIGRLWTRLALGEARTRSFLSINRLPAYHRIGWIADHDRIASNDRGVVEHRGEKNLGEKLGKCTSIISRGKRMKNLAEARSGKSGGTIYHGTIWKTV